MLNISKQNVFVFVCSGKFESYDVAGHIVCKIGEHSFVFYFGYVLKIFLLFYEYRITD